MMKKLILNTALLFPMFAFAQKGQYTIKGNLTSLYAPAIATMVCYNPVIKDTAVCVNGAFTFNGFIEEPVEVTLFLDQKTPGKRTFGQYIKLYLEPGVIRLDSQADSFAHAKISGSVLNTEYKQLMADLAPAEKKKKELDARSARMSAEQRNDSAVADSIEKRNDLIIEEKKLVWTQFFNTHPNSFLSLVGLNKVAGPIPEYQEAELLFQKLHENLKATPSGKAYAARLASLRNTAIGNIAPDFTQFDPEGKPVKLSDYKGKYVLVDFWASWCGPCRKENKNVLKSYEIYHPKGLEILGVSLDIEVFKSAWIEAVKYDKLPWKQVSDLKLPNEAAQLYGINAIPQNVLVDPNGKIIAKNLNGADLNKKLAEIF